MKVWAIILMLIVAVLAASPAKPRRTSKDVRRERQRTEQQIAATQKKIQKNQLETGRQLDRLSTIKTGMARQNDTIAVLSAQLDTINAEIRAITDSIGRLKARNEALRASYARTLRQIRTRRQGMSDLAFVFSAESFAQAWRRARHMRQTAKLHKTQAARLARSAAELDSAMAEAHTLRARQAARLNAINSRRKILSAEQTKADALVVSLRSQGRTLDRELRRRRDQAAALDRELDRVIEQEIRAAEEKARREEAARRAKAEAEAKAKAKAEAEAAKKKEAARKKAEKPAEKPAKPAPKPEPAKPAPKPKAEPKYTSQAENERALSGSFSANKGRLLFPVAGRYTIISGFGTSEHPELSKVKVDNLGIDIEVPSGAAARAIFQGVVSSIFRLEGYNNVVIVRHGSYLSVYAGLDRLNVKKGDPVRAGQTLGTVRTADTGTRLHFEIRHEKQKLNPIEWVK